VAVKQGDERGRSSSDKAFVDYGWTAFLLCLLGFFGTPTMAELRYSIPEEVKEGTVVGNVAKDLGLERTALSDRRFRVVSGSKDAFFEVNADNGALQVHKKIDREELCHGNNACVMELKILVENPLEMHHIQASDKGQPPLTGRCRVIIKLKDVNDNSPEIEVTSLSNTVSEDANPGTVISLLSVMDKDSGANGKVDLRITDDVPFELKPSYKENIYSVVTKGFLDREQVPQYEIIIKATDRGEPPLS
uniref:Cadherin domain-containing protein n=1 Tax=Cynoglossus semilaevis TaxID=244447 RepID=A0A3P8V7W1_CYNSE